MTSFCQYLIISILLFLSHSRSVHLRLGVNTTRHVACIIHARSRTNEKIVRGDHNNLINMLYINY